MILWCCILEAILPTKHYSSKKGLVLWHSNKLELLVKPRCCCCFSSRIHVRTKYYMKSKNQIFWHLFHFIKGVFRECQTLECNKKLQFFQILGSCPDLAKLPTDFFLSSSWLAWFACGIGIIFNFFQLLNLWNAQHFTVLYFL